MLRILKCIGYNAAMKNKVICIFYPFLILLGIKTASVFACECKTVALVSNSCHSELVHYIKAELLKDNRFDQNILSVLEPDFPEQIVSNAELKNVCLCVAVGAKSLEQLLKQNIQCKILNIATRKEIYEQLIHRYPRWEQQKNITAIYLDQPLDRQLDLIQHINHHNYPIEIVFGAYAIQQQETIRKLAKERSLEISNLYINKFENPVAVLDKLLNSPKIIFILADSSLYNAATTRGILLTAYHKKSPLIGYSKAFVTHGALAAVYSTPKQIATQSAQMIVDLISYPDQALEPSYPQDFSVAINYQVAESLGIRLGDENSIHQSIIATHHASQRDKS